MKAKSVRGQSTRQRIVDAAARLVYQRGVNGTSVDDVLAASNTGKSQFYHYFGSKDALVRELIGHYLKGMPTLAEPALAALGTMPGIEAWLDQLASDYDAGLTTGGCPIGNLANELASQDESLRLELQAVFATWEEALTRGLLSLKSKGQLRSETQPEELALFMVATIEGAMLLAKTEKSRQPILACVGQLKAYLKAISFGASRGALRPRKPAPLSFCP
jgi:TetR/AcrR family transcriptional repressor of nem operon